jgi:hypothetical protein
MMGLVISNSHTKALDQQHNSNKSPSVKQKPKTDEGFDNQHTCSGTLDNNKYSIDCLP